MQNSSDKNINRVAIYIRVSTNHQIDRDSLPMQRQDLISYTKLLLNTEQYVIFEDAGYSGKNTDRPKFQEMMKQLRHGLFTHLLVWKIDRISRNLLDFATMYQELKELGVTFISKNEQFDTSTAIGEAMLKIILIFAELERNMTSERVTATMISRASNGLWNGGRVPYGYNYDPNKKEFKINNDEAEVVKLIHDKYEELHSLIRESRVLNERGIITRAGNLWNPTTLQIILHNTFYCGDYQYNVCKEGNRQKQKNKSDWITIHNHHEAIISREQKERIIALLDCNRRLNKKVVKSEKYVHIFSGLLYCGNCNKPMGASPSSKIKGYQYSRYTCPTKRQLQCDSKSVSDQTVGEFVFNYILNLINSQRDFKSISSKNELQKHLLKGSSFNDIKSIDSDGLNDLYNVLLSGNINQDIYSNDVSFKKEDNSNLSRTKLLSEKQKLERALDRLTNLYLYSEQTLSEQNFLSHKMQIDDKLNEINDQLSFMESDDWQQSISDAEFIVKTSSFIISKKLDGRNYINYKRLATSIDKEVLKSFVNSVIDSIIISNGSIETITFKNGLSHTFIR
jgi:site-specific recombinases, DNA invertase pin homologs